MASKMLKISILCFLAKISLAQDFSSSLTTPVLVARHGYPLETRTVQTSDGYILTVHRIPYSPKLNSTNSRRPVALLLHGILFASSSWVLNGPGRSLAYILSDAGYDVWIGNARGNQYSRSHVSLSPRSPKFWDFSWHEIGVYDMPAMIDYALNVTGEKQVRYFGYSQGGAAFYVLTTMLPSYKDRIRAAHLLAPAVFVSNAKSPFFKLSGALLGYPNQFVELFGSGEFLPSSAAIELLGAAACRDGAVTQHICSNVVFLINGWDEPFLNKTVLPEISAIIPAGCSVKQLQHYGQLHKSGKFRQFDYGALLNIVKYGSIEPPDYKLENVEVRTYIYHSDNDILADLADVNRLIAILNETASIKGIYKVPYTEWNHLDFLFGKNVENIVYKDVMRDISNS